MIRCCGELYPSTAWNPNLVTQWKRAAIEGMATIFEKDGAGCIDKTVGHRNIGDLHRPNLVRSIVVDRRIRILVPNSQLVAKPTPEGTPPLSLREELDASLPADKAGRRAAPAECRLFLGKPGIVDDPRHSIEGKTHSRTRANAGSFDRAASPTKCSSS